MRVKLRMDKYVIWFIYTIFSMNEMDPLFWPHIKASARIYAPKALDAAYFGVEVGAGSWILLGLLFGFLGKRMSVNLL
jgi:hypothetical protein